jgi:hypothetical protein
MLLELDRIKTHMEVFAGRGSHMYLDAAGNVSVGVSNVLPDLASAQALRFIERETGELATPQQIAADFEAVQKQAKGRFPYEYEVYTSLDLPEPEVDVLFGQRIQAVEEELRSCYPAYDTFPNSGKLAVLDMVFSLGSHGLRANWPRLHTAISSGDWQAAALECARPDVAPLRNENTRALFQIASSELRALERAI